MTSLNTLKHKMRGSGNPQGKPRVYFCCHEADFGRLFEPVTEELLSIQKNMVIWYYDSKDGVPDEEDLNSVLSQMQLFVIPVTGNFIYTENRARTVEFKFAVDHHIPILPLMQESDLERDFNSVCGSLQYLDKNSSRIDPTALPYEDKLKKYLDSVLVGDELAQRIRDAFDAYIFMSYRKKDRKYAQEIMRLIHKNDFCRDIAIWYDEYLTPGENFNDAIADAMKKSSLFVFVVTPNLLEIPNYVKDNEYPEARDTGKPILPIQGVKTDEKELSRLYSGINRVITPEGIPENLREAVRDIALTENDDPVHTFLIGLAYLSGIDTEVNSQRALTLITKSAEAGLSEAYEKLVSMYQLGEGVRRDYDVALEWQKKYVDHLNRLHEEKSDDEAISKALYDNLEKLGDSQMNLLLFDDAVKTFNRLASVAFQRLYVWNDGNEISYAFEKLGRANERKGDTAKAKKCYLEALKIDEKLVKESYSRRSHRNLAYDYSLLGELCINEKDFSKAKEYCLKAFGISKQLMINHRSPRTLNDLRYYYEKLGYIYRNEKNYSESMKFSLKALEIARSLDDEEKNAFSHRRVLTALNELGHVCLESGNLSDAEAYFLETQDIAQKHIKDTETVTSFLMLCSAYKNLGDVCKAKKDYSEAKTYYLKSLTVIRSLILERQMLMFRKQEMLIYDFLGNCCEKEGQLAEEEKWYRKGFALAQQLADEDKDDKSIVMLAIFCFFMAGLETVPLEERMVYATKRVGIYRELLSKTGDSKYKESIKAAEKQLEYIEKQMNS